MCLHRKMKKRRRNQCYRGKLPFAFAKLREFFWREKLMPNSARKSKKKSTPTLRFSKIYYQIKLLTLNWKAWAGRQSWGQPRHKISEADQWGGTRSLTRWTGRILWIQQKQNYPHSRLYVTPKKINQHWKICRPMEH